MSIASAPLPSGRQFAVLWGLERTFGGMTSAMLRRSRTFAQSTGAPVDILTFDARDDYDRIVSDLRADGRLDPLLRVRNLWDELTDAPARPGPPAGTKAAALDGFAPLPAGGRTSLRRAADGTLLQLDRRRPDGTLAISDRRDTRVPGELGGRSIVLCDAAGVPVFGFTRARPFYHWWLDTVLGDEDAFLVVDSKAAAGALLEYRSPRATRIHVLHNSHLDGESRPWAPLKPTRIDVLPRLDDLDAVVVLSERQRDDLAVLLGRSDAVHVVPNAAALPTPSPPEPRDPLRGVLLGSLIDRKRVDDAIRAVALARESGADVRLDVYGEGPLRPELEALVAELGVAGPVVLHGFRPDALDEFRRASFFLLTSRSEGFPLVLTEGMSRGCIPISYDIPYGPADIIEDGRSGFLVPPADVPALSDRIAAIARGVPDGMREQAARQASAFSDEAVLERWRTVLERARERHLRPVPSFTAEIRDSRFVRRRDSFAVSADFRLRGVDVSPDQVSAAVTLRGPDAVVLRAVGGVRRTLRHGIWRAAVQFPQGAAAWLPEDMPLTRELELRIQGGLVRLPLHD
ncbi:glycosyltransferase [Naasia sp. SYSU D00948]|uniref:glycosyltransferase n=1 Tax=Naasia sp. SYSU D00948 TaxID=2817379 RepID=UPI001B300507|nr:glycosyltransferase [Naasia sp. SYSU D00948]